MATPGPAAARRAITAGAPGWNRHRERLLDRDARTGPRERSARRIRAFLSPCNIVTIKNGSRCLEEDPTKARRSRSAWFTHQALLCRTSSWVSATERGSSCTAWPGTPPGRPTALCSDQGARGLLERRARAQHEQQRQPGEVRHRAPSASMLAPSAQCASSTASATGCSSASARSSDARAAATSAWSAGVRDATPGSASGARVAEGGERAGIGGGAARYAGQARAQQRSSVLQGASRSPPVAWPPPPPHPGARSARRTPSGAGSCPSPRHADQQGLRAPL